VTPLGATRLTHSPRCHNLSDMELEQMAIRDFDELVDDRAYLETKAHKSGHLIDDSDLEQAEPRELAVDDTSGETSVETHAAAGAESDVA